MGVEELKTDPRFQERDERKKNRKALTPLLEAKLKQRPTADWVEALNAGGIPSGEILPLGEALEQPQVRHRGTLEEVEVEGIGPVKLFGLSARLEKTPGGITSAPPRLGEHTGEVLVGLGYTAEQAAALREKGVV